jgi:Glycine-zipper domain
MSAQHLVLSALAATALAACATVPSGPSVLVLPGSRSSFDDFQLDDDECRGFAAQRSGAQGATADAGARDAAVATAVGAAAGAAIGAGAGDAAAGAAIGAGTGLLWGTAYGVESAGYAADGWQRSYDNAYVQCMYAKGHQVPAPPGVALGPTRWRDRGGYAAPPRARRHAPPPSEPIEDWSPPPPPPGQPPPPPPDLD